MRILLTGRNGQVGYELERSLQGLGEIHAFDRQGMDLENLDAIQSVIRRVRPHLIVNPAAYTAVDKAETEAEKAMRINAEAPAVMAEEAARLGAAMIHYSTDYVFDGTKNSPYTEEDLPNPLNVYGASKLAGENAVRQAGIPHLVFRTSWVYGNRGQNFLLTMRRLGEQRDVLRIVNDQYGAPTWCRTIADLSAHVIAQTCSRDGKLHRPQAWSGIYHLTSQGHTTWHGFASRIFAAAYAQKSPDLIPIPARDYPTPAARPANSRLDCRKFITTFFDLPHWEDSLDVCLR